jgi:predicted phosphodiesterase
MLRIGTTRGCKGIRSKDIRSGRQGWRLHPNDRRNALGLKRGKHSVLRTALCLLAVGLGLIAKTSLAAAETFQWLQLGPTGLEARVITEEPSCPTLQLDNAQKLMGVRASSDDKFPIKVCSAPIPPDVHLVAVAGASLALQPTTELKRVAVIGDTGCRLKGDYIQACDDPNQWPFAVIAEAVARQKPDLVIHVGDYFYRETPCPVIATGCAGSPFGDNWFVWRTDFFAAADPLLKAAPWVFVRGNHEICSRGGKGWNRMLAPYAFDPSASCKTNEEPYILKLPGLTLAVMDVSNAKEEALDEARAQIYRGQYEALRTMTSGPAWILQHRPIWSPGAEFFGHFLGDNKTLAAAAAGVIPSNVMLILSGHHHLFQVLTYESDLPVQVVAGNGGDFLNPGSPTNPAGWVINGVKVRNGVDLPGAFGFSVLEKQSKGWRLTNFDTQGQPHQSCLIAGRTADCAAE